MKVLLVHPGATWSVADVWRGLFDAFEDAGAEVVQYALDGRIVHTAGWMCWVHRNKVRDGYKGDPPTQGDYIYLACVGMIERALWHRVDWVFIISGTFVHPRVLTLLKRAGLKVAVLHTESPYADRHEIMVSEIVDAVFTNERTSVKTFAPICPLVSYYQHAYSPKRHYPGEFDETVAAHDAVFVGTGFWERCQLFGAANWDGIDFGLYGTWNLLGSRNRLRKCLYHKDSIIANTATSQLYRNAKIGINHHRTSIGYGRDVEHITYAESMGPRCYELAATGTFFISDRRAEVAEVFGDLVPTFEGPRELEDLIRYWLDHETERRQIEAALPEAVKEHTFDDRIIKILDVLVYN